MILVPEIETVVILVPRTGSGSLKRAIHSRYPRALSLYRHMEADGVPAGYDWWRKVGVARDPVDRLWSLYKFLQDFGGDHDSTSGRYRPQYVEEQRASVRQPFSDWIISNATVFTHPYVTGGFGFHPYFTLRHPLPETRKSQFVYLRPDLGTDVVGFDDLARLATALDVDLPKRNATAPDPAPQLSSAADAHMRAYFGWDFKATRTAEQAFAA